jgi:hypothetical protein
MSLKGRVGSAVMKRIEALPSVQAEMERSERIGPSQRAARDLAHSPLEDEAAVAKLGERLDAGQAVLEEAAIAMSKRRDDYIDDRAYRLLSAAAAHSVVQSTPPERAGLFAREEAIGRMPLQDAFALLAESEPRLLDLRQRAQLSATQDQSGGCALPEGIGKSLSHLVGGGAEVDDELLRSTLATSIAHQYLGFVSGDLRLGPAETPFWELPRKKFVASHVFGKRRRGPAESQ